MNKKILLILSILAVFILIAGCKRMSTFSSVPPPGCPSCLSAESWSECTAEGVKTRTNYRCSAETNFQCESYTETKQCLTQLTLKATGLEAVVSPTLEEKVKGIIKVEATKVPDGTTGVIFSIAPQGTFGRQPTAEETKNTIVEMDQQAGDGWKELIDTTKLANGLYAVFVATSYEGAPQENPWTAYAMTQVVVSN